MTFRSKSGLILLLALLLCGASASAGTNILSFSVTGVPAGISVTVTGTRTAPPQDRVTPFSVTFITGSKGYATCKNGTAVTYSYPATLTAGDVTYVPISFTPPSPFDSPNAAGSRTNVVARCNARPVVTANSAGITVGEGSVARNSGTWSDADGDPVTLSASAGEVVKNGDGTWTWSAPATDGPAETISVTITADDGGRTASTSFTWDTLNVASTLTIAGEPSVTEGSSYILTLSSSDPGPDTITQWDVDWQDGTTTTLIGNPTSASHTYVDGPATRNVTATATDEDGTFRSNSLSVSVLNSPPSVTAASDQTADEGLATSFDLGSFTDAGAADADWTAVADWGDGQRTKVPLGAVGAIGTKRILYADNGVYTVTVTVRDKDGETGSAQFTVTVANLNPTVTLSRTTQTVQYSDPIGLVTVKGYDTLADRSSLTLSAYFSKDGGPFGPGLPAGLTLVKDESVLYPLTWNLSGAIAVAPGTYTLRLTLADKDGGSSSQDTKIVVKAEDAAAGYSGSTFVQTTSGASSAATVVLSACVKDVTAVTPGYDPDGGDISKATVSFVVRETGQVLASNVPVTLDDPLNPLAGTATTSVTLDIGVANSKIWTIGIVVAGCYTRDASADNAVITIARPIAGLVAGGGFLVNSGSGGIAAGTTGLRTSFGFYYRTAATPTGAASVIIRSGGKVYRVTSSSAPAAVVSVALGTASLVYPKATIVDITNYKAPVTLDTNGSVAISAKDSDPGGDTLYIEVRLSTTETLYCTDAAGVLQGLGAGGIEAS